MSKPFNEFGPFAVGEICRVVHSDSQPGLIGTFVEITSPPRVVESWMTGKSWIGYETDVPYFFPPEDYLRRRPPADSNERTYMQRWRDMAGKAPQHVREPA